MTISIFKNNNQQKFNFYEIEDSYHVFYILILDGIFLVYFIASIYLGQGALSCHYQELEHTVRRSRVREIRFYDWIELLQLIAIYLAAHHTFSRLHKVYIAAQRINFTVVSKQAMDKRRTLCFRYLRKIRFLRKLQLNYNHKT